MLPSPSQVTEDEIANAAGISDMHDGVNFMRAACVIAVEKVNVKSDLTVIYIRFFPLLFLSPALLAHILHYD